MSLTEVREAFLEGMRHLQADEFSSAERAFERAARGRPTPGLQYYVAYSQEMQGNYTEAWASYQRVRQLLVEMPTDDVQLLLPEAIQRVQALVARVELVGLLATDQVWLDEAEVDARGGLALKPGARRIEVRRTGGESLTFPLQLEAGQVTEVAVPAPRPTTESPVIEERPKDQAPAMRSEESVQRRSMTLPLVVATSAGLAAAGVGVAIFGAVRGGQAKRSADDLRDQLDSDSACVDPVGDQVALCSELRAAVDRRSTAQTLTVAGAAAGAAFGVGAVVFAALWSSTSKLEVSLRGGPRGGTLLMRGRF